MNNKNSDSVKMWEQMGSMTGSMLGKFIGLSTQMALDAFDNFVVTPAKSFEQAQSQQSGNGQQGEQQKEGIRSQTWGDMGQQFGKSMGELIGTGMDSLVKTVENNVIQPMDKMEENNSN